MEVRVRACTTPGERDLAADFTRLRTSGRAVDVYSGDVDRMTMSAADGFDPQGLAHVLTLCPSRPPVNRAKGQKGRLLSGGGSRNKKRPWLRGNTRAASLDSAPRGDGSCSTNILKPYFVPLALIDLSIMNIYSHHALRTQGMGVPKGVFTGRGSSPEHTVANLIVHC